MKTNFHIKYLILIVTLFTLNVKAQHESDNWCFGSYNSLNFSSGIPTPTNDNILFMHNGTSVSDSMGNLLFYGYGGTIIDSSQNIMQNGSGMNGSSDAMNNGYTLKKPLSDSLYNIFSIYNSPWYVPGPLYFSELDMSLNGWKGAIPPLEKNRLISPQPMARMIGSTRHYNNKDQWLVTHEFGTSNFRSYQLSDTLYLNCPVVYSNTGVSIDGGAHADWGEGQIKFSPDGSRAAVAFKAYGVVQVFDFDNSTGKLSNPISLSNFTTVLGTRGPRSVEFSSNGKVLYVAEDWWANSGSIWQFNLNAGSEAMINSSQTVIGNTVSDKSCSIQRAINGKIYTFGDAAWTLNVIDNPNGLGSACNYLSSVVSLSNGNAIHGLPHLNDFYPHFSHYNLCYGDTALFEYTNTTMDSVRWYFDDASSGLNNTSTLLTPQHYFSAPGNYQIALVIFNGSSTDTLIDNINITDPSIFNPVALGNDTSFCEGEEIVLQTNSSMGTILWSDSTSLDSIVINQTGLYWVEGNHKCGSSNDSINIVVHPLPIVVANSFNPDTTENCNIIPLPAGSPVGGIWNGNGIIGSNFDPIVATNGYHELIYSFIDSNNCANEDTTGIFINIPSPQNYSQYFSFCQDDSIAIVVNSNTYDSIGFYVDTLQNIYLCDSIIIYTSIAETIIDTAIADFGTYLASYEAGASYQWLSCDSNYALITGETNQYFTPNGNGSYAVVINKNGCTDTSSCHIVNGIGIIENNFNNKLLLYPNPTNGEFFIDLGEKYNTITITITNISGKVIHSNRYNKSQLLNLKIEEPSGVYFLKIESSNKKAIIKLVKE